MIETNEEGQSQLNEIIKNRTDTIFNEWEQGFIRDVIKIKYQNLTKNQKAVVTRLYGWLMGDKKN